MHKSDQYLSTATFISAIYCIPWFSDDGGAPNTVEHIYHHNILHNACVTLVNFMGINHEQIIWIMWLKYHFKNIYTIITS